MTSADEARLLEIANDLRLPEDDPDFLAARVADVLGALARAGYRVVRFHQPSYWTALIEGNIESEIRL